MGVQRLAVTSAWEGADEAERERRLAGGGVPTESEKDRPVASVGRRA